MLIKESKTTAIVVNGSTINRIACKPTDCSSANDEEEIHRREQEVDSSLQSSRPSIHKLFQIVLAEVRGTCESIECLEGRVIGLKGCLTSILEELATWRPYRQDPP